MQRKQWRLLSGFYNCKLPFILTSTKSQYELQHSWHWWLTNHSAAAAAAATTTTNTTTFGFCLASLFSENHSMLGRVPSPEGTFVLFIALATWVIAQKDVHVSYRQTDSVWTLQTQDTLDLRQFGTSAEVSQRQFGTMQAPCTTQAMQDKV